jgi:hypothetical protein
MASSMILHRSGGPDAGMAGRSLVVKGDAIQRHLAGGVVSTARVERVLSRLPQVFCAYLGPRPRGFMPFIRKSNSTEIYQVHLSSSVPAAVWKSGGVIAIARKLLKSKRRVVIGLAYI